MNISILYYSNSGITKNMAEHIASGCNLVPNTFAKTMAIHEIDYDFLDNSSCVIIGTPTYYASMASKMKQWLDEDSGKCKLQGKLGGAFATAGYIHGGGDLAIQGILTHMLFQGMVIYSGGGTCGEPPIHLGPVAISNSPESYQALFETYGKRMAQQAQNLFCK